MYCQKCGNQNLETVRFCSSCGAQFIDESGNVASFGSQITYYSGFWKRVAALLIDSVITSVAGFILGAFVGFFMAIGGVEDLDSFQFAGNIVGTILGWLYFALMESSVTQGTLGKMALGIKVTDLYGNPIGFGKASGRYFGKIISAIILLIGFIMAGFTKRKQALHDIMAGTLVVDK